MSPFDQLSMLLEKLKEKDLELALEIRLVTAWIKEHRESRPACIETPRPPSPERKKYQSWRKVSIQLHQRRSNLKTKREIIQTHIHAVTKKFQEMESDCYCFQVFSDMDRESKLVSADA